MEEGESETDVLTPSGDRSRAVAVLLDTKAIIREKATPLGEIPLPEICCRDNLIGKITDL